MANYVDNKKLLADIVIWRKTEQKTVPDVICEQFLLIIDNMLKSSKWRNYSRNWKEEMKSSATLNLVKYLKNFNPERSSNPFAYISQITSNCFKHVVMSEKLRLQAYERYRDYQEADIYSTIDGADCQAVDNNFRNQNAYSQKYADVGRKQPKQSEPAPEKKIGIDKFMGEKD